MVTTETSQQILTEFLSYPLDSAEEIFQRFETIPGAVCGKGQTPLQRYVCIPGTRKNKLVLVAHADTVWDDAYENPQQTTVIFENGIFKSTNPDCGIGADDRAGCAMLWALRNSGHTILLVNGEEKGKHRARFLRQTNPKLFRILNRHQFMMELDWRGTGRCLLNQVDYTKRFHKYITDDLQFQEDPHTGGCDLQFLCKDICGVNIGVGYHKWHRTDEYLDLAEWESTLQSMTNILAMDHPRFPTSLSKKLRRFAARIKNKIFKILKIQK